MKRIVVLGAGFAGLIAAVGAVRKLAELAIPKDQISVTVVNRDAWHAIRVRNYEADLADLRVPLDDVLRPIDVEVVVGEVTGLDHDRHGSIARSPTNRRATVRPAVFALGSELVRPPIPGLAEHGLTSTPTTRPPALRHT